jgi:kumamolisin
MIPLPGSERQAAPRAVPAPPADPTQSVEVTLVLRRSPSGTPGADEADLQAVTDTVAAAGLTVVLADGPSRRVRISGPLGTVAGLFGTELQQTTSRGPDGRTYNHRHRTGPLYVPAPLAGVITAVLGLDDRPQARAQFRVAAAAAVSTSYRVPDLGRIYRFPEQADGSGQRIAIIELGGGFAQSDLDTYFAQVGLPVPVVSAIGVDGAANAPGQDPDGADGEVLLDIEVAGALAPGAAIDVYFAPNTDAGFFDAVSEAVHANPPPAAISISWGQSEDQWSDQARTAMDGAFQDAVGLGITVTAAAGDNGSTDGAADGRDHTDFPASSPNVLACGGTSLTADPASGTVSAETVWNNGDGGATGGGISTAFPQPAWQGAAGLTGTGRGVPDVAAVADPRTGYQVLVDGRQAVIGGTSAVAPLWAALLARFVQVLGRPSEPLVQRLYAAGSSGFRDITEGDNGSYRAGTGWDACTGLGAPNGTDLLTRLAAAPAAGAASG